MKKLIIDDAIEEYLSVSKYINWDDAGILTKAKEFEQRCADEISLVKAIYEFVRDEIKHSWDAQDKRVTKSATEVLEQGVGICWAKANLLAAMLRACGIPTGICYQRLTLGDVPETGFCIHALNAVYIKSLDRWIRLDARGNKAGVDAQFDLEQEKLAFPVCRDLGEEDYGIVYASPSDQLMNVLEESTDALYMYLNCLPDSIFEYKRATPKDIVSRNMTDLQPWECLMKRIVWKQLGDIRDKKILDFGSGIGVTANYLAEHNDVTAIEPDKESVRERWDDNNYKQITGSTEELRKFADQTFDMIICHNVLEYAEDRADIVKEFARILKPDGKISIVKHNRAGRVMQMIVLLNDFEHAHSLLDGNNGMASKYGEIRYYEDLDIEKWCPELMIKKTLGMRTFWDMQQNQENHKDTDWQDKMVEIEMRVSDMDGYKDIAFFHHLVIEKK